MGFGCKGQLPGMGGVNQSENFLLNCSGWKDFFNEIIKTDKTSLQNIKITSDKIAIAPVTGAEQNIGYAKEDDFYVPYFTAAQNSNVGICVGDGAPDEKLKLGIDAVQKLKTKAYFFLKPYPNEKLFQRIEWIADNALGIGMDIDAYNIVTMRNQVNLEKKSVEQIQEIKDRIKVPLMIKGVFTEEDILLCEKVKPDIVVVSNHGGRIETNKGSTVEFLKSHINQLKQCCSQVWVDGGIRTQNDIKVALYFGADKVLIARPVISALCKGGINLATEYLQSLY